MEITVNIECDTLVAAIFAVADALEGKNKIFCAAEKALPAPAVEALPAPAAVQAPQGKMPETAVPKLTLEAVRDVLATLPSPKVKELLLEFGVKKLTDLNVSHYPVLLAKAGSGA